MLSGVSSSPHPYSDIPRAWTCVRDETRGSGGRYRHQRFVHGRHSQARESRQTPAPALTRNPY